VCETLFAMINVKLCKKISER